MGAIKVFYSLLVFATSSIKVESSAIQQPPIHVQNFGIFGGTPINITEVPFMALLRTKDVPWGCGASIVDQQFLITAAQCVAGYDATLLRITVGTDNAIEGGQDYEIVKLFPHPQYDPVTHNFDIAVVKLSKKLVYSDKVKPIKMATSSPKDGDILDTMGFGLTEKLQLSKELLSVKVPFVNSKKCSEYLYVDIPEQMLCAGGDQGKGFSNVDSGGPIRYNGELIGTISWGIGCEAAGLPSVYSYLPSMRDFIDKVMKDNS